jgi:hypothetical protein
MAEYRIADGGMGGFLNPPNHPEHDHHVRGPYGDCCSLSCAVSDQTLLGSIRQEAQAILEAWDRPSLDSPEVREWITQVLGYYRNCYRGQGAEPTCWHAANLLIDPERKPMEHANDHAGVRLIRKYYPEYMPTEQDFSNAHWGSKPK